MRDLRRRGTGGRGTQGLGSPRGDSSDSGDHGRSRGGPASRGDPASPEVSAARCSGQPRDHRAGSFRRDAVALVLDRHDPRHVGDQLLVAGQRGLHEPVPSGRRLRTTQFSQPSCCRSPLPTAAVERSAPPRWARDPSRVETLVGQHRERLRAWATLSGSSVSRRVRISSRAATPEQYRRRGRRAATSQADASRSFSSSGPATSSRNSLLGVAADLHQRDVGEAGLPERPDALHDRVEVRTARDRCRRRPRAGRTASRPRSRPSSAGRRSPTSHRRTSGTARGRARPPCPCRGPSRSGSARSPAPGRRSSAPRRCRSSCEIRSRVRLGGDQVVGQRCQSR